MPQEAPTCLYTYDRTDIQVVVNLTIIKKNTTWYYLQRLTSLVCSQSAASWFETTGLDKTSSVCLEPPTRNFVDFVLVCGRKCRRVTHTHV